MCLFDALLSESGAKPPHDGAFFSGFLREFWKVSFILRGGVRAAPLSCVHVKQSQNSSLSPSNIVQLYIYLITELKVLISLVTPV